MSGTSIVPFLKGVEIDREGRAIRQEQVQEMRKIEYVRQREKYLPIAMARRLALSVPEKLAAD